jgi:uncharacterized integral membrane protein
VRGRRSPGGRETGVTARQVAGLVLVVVAVVFVLENRHSTRIRFLIPEVTTPLWVALLVSLLIGAVAGVLLGRRQSR